MQTRPLEQHNSPLDTEQVDRLNALVKSLSPDQANWISGYLAGITAASPQESVPAAQSGASEAPRITILYGSETGNAEHVAELAARRAEEKGLRARAVDMGDYKPRDLKSEQLIMVVTATHGEGDPPDPAIGFHEFLHSRKAPKLKDARFAVLALGDSSYEHFCQTGRDFDARLEELGAERLCERVECDVDFEEPAEQWVDQALGVFAEHAENVGDNVVSLRGGEKPTSTRYDRNNPWPAEILENICLTGRGSGKETRHIELSLEGSGLSFEPGDVLCLMAENRSEVVNELLETLGFSGGETVRVGKDEELGLEEALRRRYEITTLTPAFLEAWAEHTGSAELKKLTGKNQRKQLLDYAWGRWVIDVVSEHPAKSLEPQAFVDMLRKLQAREYSIASSYRANPDEVHITVAAVRYHSHNRDRHGVASTWLSDKLDVGDTVPVYIRRNKNFKLPEDGSTPIIMIGPGTGVAPYRAFIEEREELGQTGPSWLFFGEQHFRTDFLYQTEWQRWLRDGALTRMDVAFSRDGEEKEYVQHRLLARSREVYQWLEDGAHIYVCGDAERMAPDVHRALIDVVRREGGLSESDAEKYIKELQSSKRYQRDVY